MKVALQEAYADSGTCLDNVADASTAGDYGIEIPGEINGSYVAQVTVGPDGGVASATICSMTATYRTDAAAKLHPGGTGATLIISGDMDAGTEVDWVCDGTFGADGSLAPEVRPSACK
jgi:hypothetical protein